MNCCNRLDFLKIAEAPAKSDNSFDSVGADHRKEQIQNTLMITKSHLSFVKYSEGNFYGQSTTRIMVKVILGQLPQNRSHLLDSVHESLFHPFNLTSGYI